MALGIELGERQLGVSRSQVSRWENGVNRPRAPYPKLLCQVFKASAEELGLLPSSSSVATSPDSPRWTTSPALPDASLEDLTPIVARYRSLSSTVPSSTLLEATVAHLRLLSALTDSARSEIAQKRVARAVNEAAAFAGRLSLDIGDYAAFCRYYRLAAMYAMRADDEILAGYTLASMSYWSGVNGERDHALAMMEQAKNMLPKHVPARIAAWLAVFEASVYSRAGDMPRTLAALDRAEESLTSDEAPWPWPAPLDPERLVKHRGFCTTTLRLPTMSIPALAQDLRYHGYLPSRWRALSLSYLAESYILTNEIEEACRLARDALAITTQLQSDRVLRRVTAIRKQLTPWKNTPGVRELDEQLVGYLLHR